jgi:RHH-type transcriptional regulator, proline utilization regulon repressor / proline dehydrogenase / delta 1-pyrroline-5-carboxylate dehydrogenase
VHLYPDRRNALGLELSDLDAIERLSQGMQEAAALPWSAAPMTGDHVTNKQILQRQPIALYSPSNNKMCIGSVINASSDDVKIALDIATLAAPAWNATMADDRAACLERMADLLEKHMPRFVSMCTLEAGKTIPDGIAELREAVDFCRYYALQARQAFVPKTLNGPTGQLDRWQLQGKGIFVCISPWNFPLAIFLGQITAALVAGNAVIAKPAEQTPLIAAAAVELLYESGIPRNVLQFLPGDGATIGAALVRDARVAGVAFTGSTDTAWAINRSLAERNAAIATLIAETGGLNTMLVDSSALPEQVVADVLASGFQSAGQRCSALRILLIQSDVAPRLLTMLTGAMAQLRIGDPAQLSTDVGPVIDQDALTMLRHHSVRMQKEARLVYSCELPDGTDVGTFFPPQLFEIDSLEQIRKEVFGPIVHVMRYRAQDLDSVIDAVNAMGYGLTFGIHSRIDSKVNHVICRIKAGNIYVNRNMIGAVVGVQPFGGMGLSGTGPKAGGPHYLTSFTTEQSVSYNTAAAGGNASLMSIGD